MGKIHHFFSDLHVALAKEKRNGEIIKSISDYLINGVYENSISYDLIKRKGRPSQLCVSTFSSYKNISKFAKLLIRIYNKVHYYHIKSNQKEKKFNGTELIISSSLSEYKIFDFRNKTVLTIYSSLEKLRMIEDNKQKLSVAYKVPLTYVLNEDKSFIVEELVTHRTFDVEDAFKFICASIKSFTMFQRETKEIGRFEFKDSWRSFKGVFGSSSLLDDDVSSLVCYTHGDMWSSNIIFNGDCYYATDFEHVGVRFFLYDFFFFMFTEWQLNNNDILINNYFLGKYDACLNDIFVQAGEFFDSNKKQRYFLLFLVSIMSDRWLNYDAVHPLINKFLNLYIPLYK